MDTLWYNFTIHAMTYARNLYQTTLVTINVVLTRQFRRFIEDEKAL
jgi:hypothetical protein